VTKMCDNPTTVTGGHRIGEILQAWVERSDSGLTWYYVEHICDGELVLSYSSSYADPADSNANPFASACSFATPETFPFVITRLDGNDSPQ
jgi:hypothetical protein